jgi:protein-S-isoprenylcysteine O-methyltransferase Ste14
LSNLLSPVLRLVFFFGAWVIWMLALVTLRRHRLEKPAKVDSAARWGVALETAGYLLVTVHPAATWNGGIEEWRLVVGILFALIAIALFWSAVANLGRHWRVDAGLNQDHELVQSGAYRIVRHPIYASMFAMLLADAFWAGTLPGWPFALVLFLTGTEIRIRVEDSLLRDRFGDRFTEWQRSVPAYLPFVR